MAARAKLKEVSGEQEKRDSISNYHAYLRSPVANRCSNRKRIGRFLGTGERNRVWGSLQLYGRSLTGGIRR